MKIDKSELRSKMLKAHYVEQLLKAGYSAVDLEQLDLRTLRLKLTAVRSSEFSYEDLQIT